MCRRLRSGAAEAARNGRITMGFSHMTLSRSSELYSTYSPGPRNDRGIGLGRPGVSNSCSCRPGRRNAVRLTPVLVSYI